MRTLSAVRKAEAQPRAREADEGSAQIESTPSGRRPHRRSSLPARDFENDPELAAQAALDAGLTERQASVLLRRAAGLTLAQIAAQDRRSKNGVFNVLVSALEKIERKAVEADRFARAAAWVEARPGDRLVGREPRVVREARAVVQAWERRKAAATPSEAIAHADDGMAEHPDGLTGIERARLNTVPRMLAEGAILSEPCNAVGRAR